MADIVKDRVSYGTGEKIFSEGDGASCAYIVEKGSVEVSVERDGETFVFSTIGGGGIFGELALIDNEPRMASARAIEPCTLVVVSRTLFNEKIAKADPFIRGLLSILTTNVRSLSWGNAAKPICPT
jgi:CRP-like cAMP-binding protein